MALLLLSLAWLPGSRVVRDDPEARKARETRPEGETPDALVFRSAALIREQVVARSQAAAVAPISSWSPLADSTAANPEYVGGYAEAGRVRAIVTDPANPGVIYVATAGGGVFKTTNADPDRTSSWQWKALTDDLPSSSAGGNIAVGDLAMSPVDSNTLWLGMGDPIELPAKGFFITHDGGASWTRGGELSTTQVWKILPLDGQTLLVGTGNGLYRTTDGGVSFTQVPVDGKLSSPGVGSQTLITTLALFPGGRILMGRHDPGGFPAAIWYSDDRGSTWTRASETHPAQSPWRITLATTKASDQIAWAIQNDGSHLMPGLLHTTDGGKTWNEVPNTTMDTWQGAYNQMLIADEMDPNLVFVGASNLHRSNDGAKTLEHVYDIHADNHTATFWTAGGKRRLLVGNDGGIVLLRDPASDTRGDSSMNAGLPSLLIYHLACTADRTVIGTQDDGVKAARSVSGPFTYIQGGDGYHVLIHPKTPDLMLFQLGSEFRTTDFGQTVALPGPIPGRYTAAPLVADEGDESGNTVYESTGAAVYRSSDFGASFAPLGTAGLPGNGISVLAVAPSDRSVLAVVALSGNDFTVYVTGNGGATWARGGTIPGFVSSLTFDSHDANTLYATSRYSGWAFRSRDRGGTFESIAHNGFPAVASWLIRNDPANRSILYAATDFGVYWSQDAGISWSRYGQGLPWVSVRDLCLLPDRGGLRVATYGRSVWQAPMPVLTALSISASPPAVTLTPGSREAVTLTVSDSADLTVSGLPAGISATLDPTSLTGPGTATLTLTAGSTTKAIPATIYTMTATHGADQATTAGRVSVRVPPGDFELRVEPARVDLKPGESTTLMLRTSVTSGPAQAIQLSADGLPGDVTASFTPAFVGASDSAVLTIKAGTIALEGDAAIVATGTDATHRAALHLRVTAPDVSLPPMPAAAAGGCSSTGIDGLTFLALLALLPRRRSHSRRPARGSSTELKSHKVDMADNQGGGSNRGTAAMDEQQRRETAARSTSGDCCVYRV